MEDVIEPKMTYRISNFSGLILLIFLLNHQTGWSQNNVGIGTKQPNNHAALHIVAQEGNQGLLIPTLTTSQREAPGFTSNLGSQENGLLIFDTDLNTFFYWMDEQWQPIISGDISNVLVAGQGIAITDNGLVTNIGDIDSTNDVTLSTLAEGDLSGTFQGLTIVPDAVTLEKIASNAVNTEKVLNNTLLPEDLRSPGAGKVLITTNGGTVFWENLSFFGITTFLPRGNIYIGDSDNKPTVLEVKGEGNILIGNGTSASSVAVGGDLSLNSTGNMQIMPEVITADEIATGAVGSDEILDGQVGTLDLADLSVNAVKLTDNAVEALKIADGAVLNGKIAADAVTTDKIADGAIVNGDINAAAAIDGSKINPNFGAQKAFSATTSAADLTNTLTTKDYVDALSVAEVGITRIQPLAAGNIIVGNGTTNQSVSISGDATLDAAGVLTLNSSNAAITLGLGSLAVQNADAVSITAGTINATLSGNGVGITDLNATNLTSGTLDANRLPASGAAAGAYGGSGQYIETITVDAAGRITAISANVPPSDRRLKKDIQPLENSLEGLLKLKPSQYQWKDPEKEGLSYGLIAQELAEVYPNLVKKRSDGYFGINYIELIPLLIKAIQEQQHQLQSLNGERLDMSEQANIGHELQSLKAENEQLKQEITLIKKALGLNENYSTEE